MEKGLTKQKIIAALAKSPHGDLMEYVDIGRQAVSTEGNNILGNSNQINPERP